MLDSASILGTGTQRTAIETLAVAEIYAALATQPGGLAQNEAAARLQRRGRNTIREVAGQPLLLKFLANFTHLMALLLWVGGLIGFIAQMPRLGVTPARQLSTAIFVFFQHSEAEPAPIDAVVLDQAIL